MIVSVAQPVALAQLKVSSPTQEWAAQVYVRDDAGATLASWGEPLDTKTGIVGDTTFDLKGTKGKQVLLWITDLGSGPAANAPPPNVNVQINEVTLTAG